MVGWCSMGTFNDPWSLAAPARTIPWSSVMPCCQLGIAAFLVGPTLAMPWRSCVSRGWMKLAAMCSGCLWFMLIMIAIPKDPCMEYLPTLGLFWITLGVNVGKYSIHGSSGNGDYEDDDAADEAVDVVVYDGDDADGREDDGHDWCTFVVGSIRFRCPPHEVARVFGLMGMLFLVVSCVLLLLSLL